VASSFQVGFFISKPDLLVDILDNNWEREENTQIMPINIKEKLVMIGYEITNRQFQRNFLIK
jgi:hypothetical protein